MIKIKDQNWTEIDSFVHSSLPKKSDTTNGIKGTIFRYVHAAHTRNPHIPSLSRFEFFPHAQTLCSEPEPLNVTQNSDLFLRYSNDFDMHTGQPSPHSALIEYIF